MSKQRKENERENEMSLLNWDTLVICILSSKMSLHRNVIMHLFSFLKRLTIKRVLNALLLCARNQINSTPNLLHLFGML